MGWLDWLRGAGKALASDTGAMVSELLTAGHPIYAPRNAEAFAKDGYCANPYVYRAIDVVASAAAALPWRLYREGRTLQELEDDAILDLITAPNSEDSGALAFWKKVYSYRLINGNSFVQAIRPLTRTAPPLELWVLRPERVQIIPAADGTVAKYRYTINGSYGRNSQDLDAGNVLHYKEFNPLDDWYGLSRISVAAKIIDQMNAANDWNTALFQNGARPDGVLSTDSRLSPDQRDILKADLKRLFQGARNARKPMVLESGLKWQQIGTNPNDMDWLEGKTHAAKEIALAIGVAPELLGDAANKTYSNIQEARKALYSETVLPLAWELRDALNAWLVPMFGDTSKRLDIDISGIEALQEDTQVKRQFALSAWQAGAYTLNQFLTAVGEEEVDPAIGDVVLVPNTVTVTPLAELVPDEDDTDPLPPAYIIPPPQLPPPVAQDDIEPADGTFTPDQHKALLYAAYKAGAAHAIEQQRRSYLPDVTAQAAAIFDAERKRMVSMIGTAHSYDDARSHIPHIIHDSRQAWADFYRQTYRMVGGDLAKQQYQALGGRKRNKAKRASKPKQPASSDDDHSPAELTLDANDADSQEEAQDITDAIDAGDDEQAWLLGIDDYCDDAIPDKIDQQDNTTLALVLAVLVGALSQGADMEQFAALIGGLYLDRFMASRSDFIADMAILAAGGLGASLGAAIFAQANNATVTKTWNTVGDDRVRPSHAAADGQTVNQDDPFDVGESQLMYPTDDSLGADYDEIANCRCWATYSNDTSADDDEEAT